MTELEHSLTTSEYTEWLAFYALESGAGDDTQTPADTADHDYAMMRRVLN
ncbi:hypothetical protein GCM10023116_46780 [Kistimonas scapharcae]|uniref:Uncharacterized protein n=1 Tax=Kistimonas scapharcae TaxID=1036133 RepID=A0ABP8VAF8_9GAMM